MENQKLMQIKAYIEEIEKRKGEKTLASYKDSSTLKEVLNIVHEDKMKDEESLIQKYQILCYVANQYESYGRMFYAAKYYKEAVEIANELMTSFNARMDDIQETISLLLKDRNYYVDDDCPDLEVLVEPLLSRAIYHKMLRDRKAHRRSLNHDPIEMSDKYLAVIDEVEEKVNQNMTLFVMGSCYQYWDLKKRFLFEKGINWKTPHELNPKVIFD